MSNGTFNMLNDALFAQMDKLQSIDPKDKEQMDLAIDQTKAVSQLATNIIDNANSAVAAMRFYEKAGVEAGNIVTASRWLGGGE